MQKGPRKIGASTVQLCWDCSKAYVNLSMLVETKSPRCGHSVCPEVAGQSVAELRAFGECLNRRDPETSSSFSGHTGYTHNTGLTHPQVELRGHQLARILVPASMCSEAEDNREYQVFKCY